MGLFFAAALWKRGLVTLADLFHRRYGAGVERLAAIIHDSTSCCGCGAGAPFGQVLAAASESASHGDHARRGGRNPLTPRRRHVGGRVTDLMLGIVLIVGITALAG